LDTAWPRIQVLFARLSELTGEWQSAHDGLEQARLQLAGWQTASYTRVERVIANKTAVSQELYEQLESLAGQAEVIEKQLKLLQKPAALPILGVFFTLLADGVATTWQEVSREHQETLQALRKEIQSARAVWESYREIVTAGEQALGFKRAIVQTEVKIELMQEEISGVLTELAELGEGLPGAPAQPETVSPSALEALVQGVADLARPPGCAPFPAARVARNARNPSAGLERHRHPQRGRGRRNLYRHRHRRPF
jgi:hypothetical protein